MDMPYDFVLDYLDPLQPRVKRMFGTYAIYAGDKIYLATRLAQKAPEDNGIWFATAAEHHANLFAQFPALTYLNSIGMKKWLLLPDRADDFEAVARELCLLIVAEDERLGVLPKPRKK